jgi:hypothetical protein
MSKGLSTRWMVMLKLNSPDYQSHYPLLVQPLNKKITSVAEPEPVERQLLAGGEVFLARLRSRVCKLFFNVTKTLNFSLKI